MIDGLPSGDYELRESAAPSGYRTREEVFCFRVSNGQLTQIAPYPDQGWTLTAYGDGRYLLTVTDEALFTFPATGGCGIYVSAALGTVIMCAAAWLMPACPMSSISRPSRVSSVTRLTAPNMIG